jgi:SAM-dependent methyltransferase
MNAIQNPPRGAHRFQRFQRDFTARFKAAPTGKLLDFGCGAGEFLQEAINAGLDAHGVDIATGRRNQFHAAVAPKDRDRFVLYDGAILPFPSNSFDLVYSWFVFEHVPDTGQSLREIVRIMKPGALFFVAAEDTRNAWDGHVRIPWPPFMPRRFAQAYLRPFQLEDKAKYMERSVVYVTAPQVVAILTSLGCEILHNNPDPPPPFCDGLYIGDEASAEAIGATIKKRFDAGELKAPSHNLEIWARKIPEEELPASDPAVSSAVATAGFSLRARRWNRYASLPAIMRFLKAYITIHRSLERKSDQ